MYHYSKFPCSRPDISPVAVFLSKAISWQSLFCSKPCMIYGLFQCCCLHAIKEKTWYSQAVQLQDSEHLQTGHTLLPHVAKTFDDFVLEVKAALDSHSLDMRPIEYIFSEIAPFNPTCDGLWAEFGVASGKNCLIHPLKAMKWLCEILPMAKIGLHRVAPAVIVLESPIYFRL